MFANLKAMFHSFNDWQDHLDKLFEFPEYDLEDDEDAAEVDEWLMRRHGRMWTPQPPTRLPKNRST